MHIQVKMPLGRPTSCLAHSTCRPRRALAYRLPQLLARVSPAGRWCRVLLGRPASSSVATLPSSPRRKLAVHLAVLSSSLLRCAPRPPRELVSRRMLPDSLRRKLAVRRVLLSELHRPPSGLCPLTIFYRIVSSSVCCRLNETLRENASKKTPS
jgi:hypothetical protein